MVINRILSYLLLLLGIIFMIFPYRFTTFYWLMFISFAIALLFKFIIKKLELTEKEYFVVLIIIWLNVLGELWFYFNFLFYDKLLHFIVPFSISYIYCGYLKKNKQRITYFFPFTILGMLAFFEIFEWIIDTFIGFPMLGVFDSSGSYVMSKLTDTMIDLCVGISGIMVFLFTRWKKN